MIKITNAISILVAGLIASSTIASAQMSDDGSMGVSKTKSSMMKKKPNMQYKKSGGMNGGSASDGSKGYGGM